MCLTAAVKLVKKKSGPGTTWGQLLYMSWDSTLLNIWWLNRTGQFILKLFSLKCLNWSSWIESCKQGVKPKNTVTYHLVITIMKRVKLFLWSSSFCFLIILSIGKISRDEYHVMQSNGPLSPSRKITSGFVSLLCAKTCQNGTFLPSEIVIKSNKFPFLVHDTITHQNMVSFWYI